MARRGTHFGQEGNTLWELLSHSFGLTSKEASGASLFGSETLFSIKGNLSALVILGFWVGQMRSILKS